MVGVMMGGLRCWGDGFHNEFYHLSHSSLRVVKCHGRLLGSRYESGAVNEG